ncbi:MAG: hypothetical protein PF487_03510 [Bacteroidales bacterium]|jgi:hypothetical protein|nr:hypothetical protein [Bacteroidales bacterium]
MENILNIINEEIKSFYLNENINIDDWVELEDEYIKDIFDMLNNGEHIKFRVIPKNPYHKALQEFMKYREFYRFPESKIFQWKDLILSNIAKLHILTAIAGHTEHFPFDEFYDVFDNEESYNSNQYNLFSGDLEDVTVDGEYSQWRKQKYKETGNEDYIKDYHWDTAYEFLDEVKHMDNYLPLFSNGQWILSDFGLKPLYKLGREMADSNDATELIVLINKVLDVSHQRSDLAELFIEGGSATLDYISG